MNIINPLPAAIALANGSQPGTNSIGIIIKSAGRQVRGAGCGWGRNRSANRSVSSSTAIGKLIIYKIGSANGRDKYNADRGAGDKPPVGRGPMHKFWNILAG